MNLIPDMQLETSGNRADERARMEPLITSINIALDQIQQVISQLSFDQYAALGIGGLSGVVGAHVRHCLDHVAALIAGAENSLVDYENRHRDSAVQHDRETAIATIRQLQQKLAQIKAFSSEHPVQCVMLVDIDSPPVRMQSTLGREALYVMSHTIHHNAILAAIVRAQGGTVPENMGMAPSTLAHQRAQACAR